MPSDCRTTRHDLIEAASIEPRVRHLWFTLLRYLFPRWYARSYERRGYGEQIGNVCIVWGWGCGSYDTALCTVHGTPTPHQAAKLHGATTWEGMEARNGK